MANCLQNNIGLSQINCNCPDFAGKGADVSNSGFYIDDELSLQPFVYGDCGQGSIWDILQRAKAKAILDFQTDFNAELTKRYTQRVTPFQGVLSTRAYSGVNTGALQYNGVRIDFKGYRGQKMVLTDIEIGNNLGGATVVKVWKGYSLYGGTISNYELVQSNAVTLSPNVYTKFTFPTPISVDFKEGEHYFVTYNLPVGSFPFQNIYPNCGSCNGLDTKYKDTIDVSGFSIANEGELSSQNCCNANAFGMILTIQIYCDVREWFCRLEKLGNISGEYMAVSKALVFKSGINAVQTLLDNNAINFTTLTSRESLYGKRAHLQKEYDWRLQWLSNNFPINDYNCMTCGNGAMTTMPILT